MTTLRYTLLTDGTSDRLLMPILERLLVRRFPDRDVLGEWADPTKLRPTSGNLDARIQSATEVFPCDVLFVHRDAENQPPGNRLIEIDDAMKATTFDGRVVHVIPVRMSEAWLLVDEHAIRYAANNPNGKQKLDMPSVKTLEMLPDPKKVLFDLLREASGLNGRRAANLKVSQMRLVVARRIQNLAMLVKLPAFKMLVDEVNALV